MKREQGHMDLLKRIDEWYEEGMHWEIVREIEAVPENERNYEIWGQYAVALNNMGRYQDAITALDKTAATGREDAAWSYRRAYAFLGLKEYEKALALFEHAVSRGRNEEYMYEHIRECQRGLERQQRREADRRDRQERKRKKAAVLEQPFEGFDLSDFWDDNDYAIKEYVSPAPTDAMIQNLEAELGYKLPESYLWLMRQHNGGIPRNTCCPCEEATGWAEDHIAITGILGIGREKANTIGGSFGSRFWIEEWGYPNIGVAICDCPSAGHDMVFLDYRYCGPDGEPEVAYINQEADYEITYLAADFETFIRMLQPEDEFDYDE